MRRVGLVNVDRSPARLALKQAQSIVSYDFALESLVGCDAGFAIGADSAGAVTRGFEEFVATHERRLRQALTAAFGIDHGRDAAADALAYAWEHRDRVAAMANPAGYVFVVGRDRQRRRVRDRRSKPVFDVGPEQAEPWCEPALVAQLAGLSDRERIAVMLVNGFEWSSPKSPSCWACRRARCRPMPNVGWRSCGRDGGDAMTIDEQLREIARHADQHQRVITADEIVQRASGQTSRRPARRGLRAIWPPSGIGAGDGSWRPQPRSSWSRSGCSR